jgi:cytochrome c5
MKLKRMPLVLALALAIGAMTPGCTREAASPAADAGAVAPAARVEAATAASGDDHHADHADAAQAAGTDFPVPDNHVPWTPDAPLIEGMSRVRTAIDGLEAQPDQATVVARTDDVDAAIKYMFDNCQLDTEPDIALHAILARLMAGSKALHANPANTMPVHDMRAAVANYERLFANPNG